MVLSSSLSKPEDKLLITLVKTLSGSFWSTLAVVVVVSAIAIAVVVNGFDLQVSGGLALYFVIWWILLFAVLPFGVRSQAEAGDVVRGSEPGAPALPALREKAIWTTLAASVVLVVVAAVFPLAGL
jgi:predicted secreted protein